MAQTFPLGVRNRNTGGEIQVFDPQAWQSRLRRPVLEYCAPVFHHALPQYLSDDIERVQKRALSIICPYASYSECLVRFDLVTLHARRVALCSKLFESITSCPDHKLVPVLPPKREHRHNLRQSRAYAMPRTHTNRFKNTFIPSMCT